MDSDNRLCGPHLPLCDSLRQRFKKNSKPQLLSPLWKIIAPTSHIVRDYELTYVIRSLAHKKFYLLSATKSFRSPTVGGGIKFIEGSLLKPNKMSIKYTGQLALAKLIQQVSILSLIKTIIHLHLSYTFRSLLVLLGNVLSVKPWLNSTQEIWAQIQ